MILIFGGFFFRVRENVERQASDGKSNAQVR